MVIQEQIYNAITGAKFRFDISIDAPVTISKSPVSEVGEMCLNKWILLSVMGTLFALIVIQSTVVLTFIFKRIAARNAKLSSS